MRSVSITGGPLADMTTIIDTRTLNRIEDFRRLVIFIDAGGTVVAMALKTDDTTEKLKLDELDAEAVLMEPGAFARLLFDVQSDLV